MPHDYFPRLTVVFDEANNAQQAFERIYRRGFAPPRSVAAVLRNVSAAGAQGEYLCVAAAIGACGGYRAEWRDAAELYAVRSGLETIRQMLNKEKAERRAAIDAALVGEKFPPPRRLIARCTCLIARALIARRRHAALR